MNHDFILDEVFIHCETVVDLINSKTLNNDEVYKIFQNICYLLNRPYCSSDDEGKTYDIIKSLFDNNYTLGVNHLTALLEKNDGPYFYYYVFETDIIDSLKLFINNGIHPQEYHISPYTSPNVIKVLYQEGYDFIDSYIKKCLKKNKSRFVKEMIEFLKDINDFNNRQELIELLSKKKTYEYLLNS
ncbi:hypothetical protein QKU48_gp1243 [Fadolivirus algeromassiliense]|jgi:hypothetical protein|uniref:Uncharacterized protein n=1 Tax=Fadolivirus FV1/VV64 TaxID=3070911 RepID=A0A7D3R1Z0_9VIRU|nr:hypothetical protein QKU48_gp1243 [Fadolivirus algeromassiliense]QKF94701.1 hypothetical protein Fadolivirus_1_1243 [Fadolivirus FV1/VV64]